MGEYILLGFHKGEPIAVFAKSVDGSLFNEADEARISKQAQPFLAAENFDLEALNKAVESHTLTLAAPEETEELLDDYLFGLIADAEDDE